MEGVQKRSIEEASDDYRSELLQDLKDPQYAAMYLKGILADGDPDTIAIALKDIADVYSASVHQHTSPEPGSEIPATVFNTLMRDQVGAFIRALSSAMRSTNRGDVQLQFEKTIADLQRLELPPIQELRAPNSERD